jgi:asparagine synthetase B (glutamine-hydrolysing)
VPLDPTGIRATYRWQDHEAARLDPLLEAMGSAGTTPVLDPVALGDLVTLGTPLGDRTLIRGVSRHVPEEPFAAGPGGGDDDWVDAYLDTLRRSTRTALASGQRPGCTLSGGLDSRTIAALAVAEGARPLAVTFGAPGLPDREIATAVAGHLGLDHRCDALPPDGPLPWLDLVAEHTSGTGNLALVPGLPTHEAVAGRIDVLLSGASGDALYGGPVDSEAGEEGWLERLLQPLRADRRRLLLPGATSIAGRLVEARLPQREGEAPAARWLRHLLRWRQATVIADGVRLRTAFTPVSTPFLEPGSRRLALALPDRLRADRRLQRLALERLDPDLAAIPLAGELPSPGLASRSSAYARGRVDHLLRNLRLRGTPERGVAFDVQTAFRQREAWQGAAESLCEAPPPGVEPDGLRRLWDRHRAGRDNHGLLLGRLLVAKRFVDRWDLRPHP